MDPRARWLVPGFLFGLTALIRPEYLLVGVAFALLAAIRIGPRTRLATRSGRRRPVRRRAAAPDRPLDDPQPGHPRPHRADLDRRRQGALRRHLPARRRRIPAGQGDAGRALPAPRPRPRTPRRSNGSTRRRSSTASPPATRTCRATRRWARSASRTSPSTSAKTRVGYAAMTGAQGLADVERRHRRSDESAAGRVIQVLLVLLGLAGLVLLGAAPPLVGAGRDGDPDRPRHRRRRSLAGGAAAQRDPDDADLSACRRGPGASWVRPYPPAAHGPPRQASSPPS